MVLEVFCYSPEHSEEDEEATPRAVIEVQPKIPNEQSPTNIVAGVLSELAPPEEVAGFESGGGDEHVEAPTFAFKGNNNSRKNCRSSTPHAHNKETVPIEQPPIQISDETAVVKQPPAQIS